MSNNPFFSWRQALLHSGLGPTTKHVLLTLGCHMNDAGESCYPSIARLCVETSLSKQSVITHLKLAEEAGWIEVEKHGFKGQRWARNEYKLAWPEQTKAVNLLDHTEGNKVVNLVIEGGQRGIQKAVKEVDTSTSYNSSKSTSIPADPPKPQIELPPWLNPLDWKSFVDYRKEIKEPLKERGMRMAIKKLDRLRQQGHPPAAVIRQTVESINCWLDLFPVRNTTATAKRAEADATQRGEEMGLYPKPGESMNDFARRVDRHAQQALRH